MAAEAGSGPIAGLRQWFGRPADLRSPSAAALLVAAAYAVVGALWIALSDPFLASLNLASATELRLQTLKGWGFVGVTALALFVFLRAEFRRRRKAVETMRDATEQLHHHVEHTPLALVEWDREFRVRRWSNSAEELFGWSADEAMGKKWTEWELVHPDGRGELERFLSRLPLSKPGGTIQVQQNARRDGETIWCEWYTSWRKNVDGELTILSLIHDITADRAAMDEVQQVNLDLELRLTQRTRQLTRANRDLRAFTRSISQDLRDPVKSVISFAEQLRDDFADELPQEARRNLIHVLAAGRHMDHLIEDLLEYASLGKGDVTAVPIDVHEVARDVAGALESRFPEASSAIALPRSAITVTADPALVERVLTQVLDNALKYRDPSRPARVDVTAERTSDEVVVRVRDNGPGIPGEQRERVFRLFHRLHGQENYPGTGTGLAIVQKAMTLMGGSVRVEEPSGPGTTFALHFPARELSDEFSEAGAEGSSPEGTRSPGTSPAGSHPDAAKT